MFGLRKPFQHWRYASTWRVSKQQTVLDGSRRSVEPPASQVADNLVLGDVKVAYHVLRFLNKIRLP